MKPPRPLVLVLLLLCTGSSEYVLDDHSGLGRSFDGIGAISGGGATSRLLVDYDDKHLQEVLDYLFLPNFGASLHIFKVEIGGDAQSTDGTESSHMHSPDDENYQRGYEWYLMKEAKKRNPAIKLYGLPWGWPGWIGNGTMNPFIHPDITVDYTVKWIAGAKKYHDLTIDYIGIWNEKAYSVEYIKKLRAALDSQGFSNVKIVAADGKFGIVGDVLKDEELADAISVLGFHYLGTVTTEDCWKTNKTLWSSEDYSTFNDDIGAGCWARILNQNYVNGNMTSTISWNLIASYYDNLPYFRDGLMTAIEPWSGHYIVESPIWITAHTTQFTQPGWSYLQHGAGAGHLDKGGSYVSMTDGQDLTMVIETMSHDQSVCIRPPLPHYNVTDQTASFSLQGSFAAVSKLYVWYSRLGEDPPTLFEKTDPISVVDGSFSLTLHPDEVYTLTTLDTGKKGTHPPPPPSAVFPVPHFDNFEKHDLYSEAFGFADQAGVYEIRDSGDAAHGKVMQQVAVDPPVKWCSEAALPITYIGNHTWSASTFRIDAFIGSPTGGALLAARVNRGGCRTYNTDGIFFFVFANGTFLLTSNILQLDSLASGQAAVSSNQWFNMQLGVKHKVEHTMNSIGMKATRCTGSVPSRVDFTTRYRMEMEHCVAAREGNYSGAYDTQVSSIVGWIDGKEVFHISKVPEHLPQNGFLAVGAADFARNSPMMFDNFNLTSASVRSNHEEGPPDFHDVQLIH